MKFLLRKENGISVWADVSLYKETHECTINNLLAEFPEDLEFYTLDKINIPPEIGGYAVTEISSAKIFITNSMDNRSLDVDTLIIPDTVEIVQNRAFSECRNYFKVIWSKNCPDIPSECFAKSDIEEIVLPNGIKTISEKAFFEAITLQIINLPESLIKIGMNAFDGCKKLEEITFPSNIHTIGTAAFKRSGLKEIIWPENCPIIPAKCFQKCPFLKSVVIGNNVKKIGKYALSCKSIQELDM